MSIGRVPGVTGIQPSIVDAKGDLIVATAADSVDRLAVGANNLVLTADSATATGLKWAAPDPLTTKGDLFTFSTTEARLGVGANGTVLTADSAEATGLKWASVAGGAYTSLATGSLSGSSVSLTSISGSYTDLYLVLRDVNLNTDGTVNYRLNNDTTANFHISALFGARPGGGFNTSSQYLTSIQGAWIAPMSGDGNNTFSLRVNDYTTSLKKNGIAQGSYKSDDGNDATSFNAWAYSGISAITRIDIITSSTFNGGTYILYGVK